MPKPKGNETMKNATVNAVNLTSGTVDAKAFGSLLVTIGGQDAKLTKAANAATVQLVQYGNPKWLNQLFAVEGMIKVNGDLTKRGAELKQYITAHAPVTLTLKDGIVNAAQTKNKKNKGLLIDPTQKDDDGAPLKVSVTEQPDFALTLADWRNMQSPKDDGPKNKKAATLLTQLETMAALLRGEKDAEVIASAAELKALEDLAGAVQDAAIAAKIKAQETESEQRDALEKSIIETATGTAASPNEKRADVNREKHAATNKPWYPTVGGPAPVSVAPY